MAGGRQSVVAGSWCTALCGWGEQVGDSSGGIILTLQLLIVPSHQLGNMSPPSHQFVVENVMPINSDESAKQTP